MPPLGRFLLVELEGGMHPSRHTGIFYAVRSLPGVRSVSDAAVLTPDDLAWMLRQPEPAAVIVPHERVQQLELVP